MASLAAAHEPMGSSWAGEACLRTAARNCPVLLVRES
uniref:Uncharacterized protein n=1 Tax=Tetraselmis sp. GSL018 TaxID=582737 RepID=A0A061RAV8_9CHLO